MTAETKYFEIFDSKTISLFDNIKTFHHSQGFAGPFGWSTAQPSVESQCPLQGGAIWSTPVGTLIVSLIVDSLMENYQPFKTLCCLLSANFSASSPSFCVIR
jgi:hypothetical protein